MAFLARLAFAGGRVVGEHVAQETSLQPPRRMLWLLALLACADQGAVGDYVWHEALVQNCFEELHGSLGSVPFAQALIKAL